MDPPKGTEGEGRRTCQATSNHLPAVLINWSWLEADKYNIHLQEGLEGASQKLQACQSDLGAREGHGPEDLERHDMEHKRQT